MRTLFDSPISWCGRSSTCDYTAALELSQEKKTGHDMELDMIYSITNIFAVHFAWLFAHPDWLVFSNPRPSSARIRLPRTVPPHRPARPGRSGALRTTASGVTVRSP